MVLQVRPLSSLPLEHLPADPADLLNDMVLMLRSNSFSSNGGSREALNLNVQGLLIFLIMVIIFLNLDLRINVP